MLAYINQSRLRTLLFALGVTAIVVFLIALSIGPIRTFINNDVSRQAAVTWQSALDKETQYIVQQSDSLAKSNLVPLYLERNDITNLVAYSVDEAARRKIDSILVTNKDGLVLSRSLNANKRGDYLAETTSWASEVVKGHTFSSVESGPASMFLLAGQPVMSGTETIGGIFSVQILNDATAQRLRNTYWSAGSELAFVGNQAGLVGTSFTDPAVSRLLQTYLNEPTSVNKYESSGSRPEIKLGNHYYVVTVVPIHGLSGDVGSVLVFTPDSAINIIILLGLLAALCFFLVEVAIHRIGRKTRKEKYHIGTLAVFEVIVLWSSLWIFAILWARTVVDISLPLYTIYNSTIGLKPDNNLIQEGFEQRIAIQVVTGGEYINASEAEVSYDPKKVSVEEIVTDHSFCDSDFFIQKDIDPGAGKVTIVCGLPNPGFTGTGTLAELLVKPLQVGSFTLNFTENTTVLANDGLATNVLRARTDGSYQVTSPDFSSAGSSLLVYSPTHPNTTRWYQNSTVLFVWSDGSKALYRYAVSASSSYHFLGNEPTTSKNSVVVNLTGEGTHYFHVQRIDNGKKSAEGSYSVNVDTTPPESLTIKASNPNPQKGEVVRFEFSATDMVGGVQSGYYVKIDNGLFLPVGRTLLVPFLQSGKHAMTLRVFDKANNYSETSIDINVQ